MFQITEKKQQTKNQQFFDVKFDIVESLGYSDAQIAVKIIAKVS